MGFAEQPPGFSTIVEWQPTWVAMPIEMETVLIAFARPSEPCAGYWDGERWYSTDGHDLSNVTWWAPMPSVPPPLKKLLRRGAKRADDRRRSASSPASSPSRSPSAPLLRLVVSR